jgi:hypothetical protein
VLGDFMYQSYKDKKIAPVVVVAEEILRDE